KAQKQRRKYTKNPAGKVARVRPHRTIVRGGSRITRGKRSVFPERGHQSLSQITSQFIDFVKNTTIFMKRTIKKQPKNDSPIPLTIKSALQTCFYYLPDVPFPRSLPRTMPRALYNASAFPLFAHSPLL